MSHVCGNRGCAVVVSDCIRLCWPCALQVWPDHTKWEWERGCSLCTKAVGDGSHHAEDCPNKDSKPVATTRIDRGSKPATIIGRDPEPAWHVDVWHVVDTKEPALLTLLIRYGIEARKDLSGPYRLCRACKREVERGTKTLPHAEDCPIGQVLS